MRRFLKKHGLDLVFVLPLVIFILGFTMMPILQTFLMGFKAQYTAEWGFESYRYIFGRPQFKQAVINTLTLTFMALVIQIVMGFGLAMLLKQTFIGKGIARALVLLPLGVPTLVSGVAMTYIFGTSGYLNEIVYRLGISNIPINWTEGYLRSMFIVSIADSWKVMPMVVLLFLSGLESVPTDLYEAGNLDGTSGFQRLVYITIPQVKAVATMTILMRMVDLLRIFEMPQVLLGQGVPFMGTLAYTEYQYGNASYSAAVSTALMLLIVVMVSLYMSVFERERKGRKNAR